MHSLKFNFQPSYNMWNHHGSRKDSPKIEYYRLFRWCFQISAIFVFLTSEGCSMFLCGSFEEILVQEQLRVYGSENYHRSTTECPLVCVKNRLSKPPCLAFTFDTSNKTCNYFTISSSKYDPGVYMFVWKVSDTFNTISSEDRVYSILSSSAKKNYTEARKDCNEAGGYLLQFDETTEVNAVKMTFYGIPNPGLFWIGINKLETGTTWVTDREGAPINKTTWPLEISTSKLTSTSTSTSTSSSNSSKLRKSASISSNYACGVFDYAKQAVYPYPCDKEVKFLCEKDVI